MMCAVRLLFIERYVCSAYVIHRERCAVRMLFIERCAVRMLFIERGVQCVCNS